MDRRDFIKGMGAAGGLAALATTLRVDEAAAAHHESGEGRRSGERTGHRRDRRDGRTPRDHPAHPVDDAHAREGLHGSGGARRGREGDRAHPVDRAFLLAGSEPRPPRLPALRDVDAEVARLQPGFDLLLRADPGRPALPHPRQRRRRELHVVHDRARQQRRPCRPRFDRGDRRRRDGDRARRQLRGHGQPREAEARRELVEARGRCQPGHDAPLPREPELGREQSGASGAASHRSARPRSASHLRRRRAGGRAHPLGEELRRRALRDDVPQDDARDGQDARLGVDHAEPVHGARAVGRLGRRQTPTATSTPGTCRPTGTCSPTKRS